MTKREQAANKKFKLRACPFCHSKSKFKESLDGKSWWIYCAQDDCWSFGPHRESPDKAARAWNREK